MCERFRSSWKNLIPFNRLTDARSQFEGKSNKGVQPNNEIDIHNLVQFGSCQIEIDYPNLYDVLTIKFESWILTIKNCNVT